MKTRTMKVAELNLFSIFTASKDMTGMTVTEIITAIEETAGKRLKITVKLENSNLEEVVLNALKKMLTIESHLSVKSLRTFLTKNPEILSWLWNICESRKEPYSYNLLSFIFSVREVTEYLFISNNLNLSKKEMIARLTQVFESTFPGKEIPTIDDNYVINVCAIALANLKKLSTKEIVIGYRYYNKTSDRVAENEIVKYLHTNIIAFAETVFTIWDINSNDEVVTVETVTLQIEQEYATA